MEGGMAAACNCCLQLPSPVDLQSSHQTNQTAHPDWLFYLAHMSTYSQPGTLLFHYTTTSCSMFVFCRMFSSQLVDYKPFGRAVYTHVGEQGLAGHLQTL